MNWWYNKYSLCSSALYPEDGSRTGLRNVWNTPSNHTASHLTRKCFSQSPSLEQHTSTDYKIWRRKFVTVVARAINSALITHPFIHSTAMCRMRWFLAVLSNFFHSSLLCTFSCHPSPPTILSSSLTHYCHLFLDLPLNLVVPKFIYNTVLGFNTRT